MEHALFFEPHHAPLQQRLAAFGQAHLEPLEQGWMGEEPPSLVQEEARAREVLALLAQEGLTHFSIPDAGGRLDRRALCLIREGLAYHSALADFMFAMQGLGSFPLALAGEEPLKARWLPRVAAGEVACAFALTEAEAGSDVAGIQTTAVRDADSYVITGAKRLISNAGLAGVYMVFARTGEAGARGLSAFLVEGDRPGLEVVRRHRVMAPHPLGDLRFSECRVPASHRLGEEGRGFAIAMGTLDRFRTTVGAAALGMGRRALAEAVRHATTRRQFGKALSDQQAIRFKLAEMETRLEAARLLVYQAARLGDVGAERITREAAMAKWWATEAASMAIDEAVQIHGGSGVVQGSVVERLYREIRPLRIYEGTSEIQHLVIAGELLKKAQS